MTTRMKAGLLIAALVVCGCGSSVETRAEDVKPGPAPRLQSRPVTVSASSTATVDTGIPQGAAKAYFAGGCFWCMEASLEKVTGVLEVISGYTGGQKVNPTYHEVGSGTTGHAESVEVIYFPKQISYAQLLDDYWHNVDPFAENRQFCDAGTQYRSAIFYQNEEEHKLANESLAKVQARFPGKKIFTQIVPASAFYKAEDYHQDYYKKNPVDYLEYREGCRRDARLKEIWGKDAAAH